MYISIQTVCGCHGLLVFESIHCDRCRSLIPFQITDESLIDPVSTHNIINEVNTKAMHNNKYASNMLLPYRKQQHYHTQNVTTGRVRFRALCPFCNSPTYVLRYYCKRERLYYHVRIQNFGENEQSTYKSIAEIQNMNTFEQHNKKHDHADSSAIDSIEDSYSLSGSISQKPPSTILYDQSGAPTARDIQIENEKNLYALGNLEGDLFNILRNGLFFDTLIQCQDDVKLQVHRCILGGRSAWFRQLLGEHHDTNTEGDYVLQISIDDVQSVIMNEILNFIYTNRCLISLKNAPELLIAAKRFELEKLRRQIADFLLSRLTVDNAIDMLISAHEAGSEPLKSACIRLINRNAEKIKRTEKWKTFKTQYVDLVPELYENRVENPVPAPPVVLPDVFSGPVIPSESLLTLSQLYENPVKQRANSSTLRILPPPTKSRQNNPPPSNYHTGQHHQSNQLITQGRTGSFAPRHNSTLTPMDHRQTPVKKGQPSKTQRRPAPQPTVPSLTRTVFPTIKQSTEGNAYRRPVNIYEKSVALPTNNPKKQPVNNQAPPKSVAPSPVKVVRAPSPRHIIELERSPTLTDTPPEDHMNSERVISAQTID